MECSATSNQPFTTSCGTSPNELHSKSENEFLSFPMCQIIQMDVITDGQVPGNGWDSMVVNQNESVVSSQIDGKCGGEALQSRQRKKRRPFSPELFVNSEKSSVRPRAKKKGPNQDLKSFHYEGFESKSFSCDKCGSSYVVNPSRCRLPASQLKKIATKRKKIDLDSNKVLNLCNACGLAFNRAPRREKGQAAFSIEDRDKYLAEAAIYAKSIAQSVGKPAAERLYCPSFKNKPCGCIQTYLSHQGDNDAGTLETRVESLLELFNTACDLSHRKHLFPECMVQDQKRKDDNNSNAVERKQRQREFEQFILDTRQLLRDKLRLCERACQRILLYSNNFLHKRLKSTPNQSSRLSRQLGRNQMGQLRPIDELGCLSCCSDSCSRLALTHSTLLEEWRKQAAQGQRQARRVLAEMLTPSGGTKANCYKFISMVTGCGPSTISSVSQQMRLTKGNREPPEHGLKKWYREHPRKKTKPSHNSECDHHSVAESSSGSLSCLDGPGGGIISLNTAQEYNTKIQLEQKRKELEEAKRQLHLKQQELDHCQQIIDQHFNHHGLQIDHSNSNPLWKVNVIKSSVKEAEGRTHTNLPVESGITLSGLPRGQSVQLMDLVPGTYIAVPTNFNTSAILTVAPEEKQNVPLSGNASASGDVQYHPEAVYPDSLHVPQSSCNTSNVLTNTANCVQTVFNISEGSEVNTILPGVEVTPHVESSAENVLISVSSDCNGFEFKSSVENRSPNVSVINTPQNLQCLSDVDGSRISALNSHTQGPTSHPTPVIRPCSSIDPNKPVLGLQNSSVLTIQYPQPLKDVKHVECIGGFDIPTSLNSVILLSSTQQAPHPSTTLNALETLYQ